MNNVGGMRIRQIKPFLFVDVDEVRVQISRLDRLKSISSHLLLVVVGNLVKGDVSDLHLAIAFYLDHALPKRRFVVALKSIAKMSLKSALSELFHFTVWVFIRIEFLQLSLPFLFIIACISLVLIRNVPLEVSVSYLRRLLLFNERQGS